MYVWTMTYSLSSLTNCSIVKDERPLPPYKESSTEEEDDALFEDDPWVAPPFRADNGNIRIGKGSFINCNCVVIDTCMVTIGSRVMFGPSVHLYSGTHPVDPDLRNGIKGPEMGAEIVIGDDCWIGGNVTILPGVRVGRGSTVGAGSVVTKVRCVLLRRRDGPAWLTTQDVAEYSVVAGNPARFLRPAPRNTLSEAERGKIYDIAMASS